MNPLHEAIAVAVALVGLGLAFSLLLGVSIPHRFDDGWGHYCTRCNATLRHIRFGAAHPLYCRDKFPDPDVIHEIRGVLQKDGTCFHCYVEVDGTLVTYRNGHRIEVPPTKWETVNDSRVRSSHLS